MILTPRLDQGHVGEQHEYNIFRLQQCSCAQRPFSLVLVACAKHLRKLRIVYGFDLALRLPLRKLVLEVEQKLQTQKVQVYMD